MSDATPTQPSRYELLIDDPQFDLLKGDDCLLCAAIKHGQEVLARLREQSP